MQTQESTERGAHLLELLPLFALAWGALAFGAVYSWAYWPLAGLCVLSGLAAVLASGGRLGTSAALNVALTVVGAAIAVQLVPLPNRLVAAISPHSGAIVGRLSPAFAAGLEPRHAVSVWPQDTFT